MTWIIRDGEVLNPGGDGIRLKNAPVDVEISRMMVAAKGAAGISIRGAAGPSRIEFDELIKLLREHLDELPGDERATAAGLLNEVEKNAPKKRVMSALRVIYDMVKSLPGSVLGGILRDVLRDS